MKKMHFEIAIDAPADVVWNILWNPKTYTQWTSVFCEGSYAESNWNQGDKILFLSPGGEGMFSVIAEKKDNQIMAFRHIGMVKDLVEQPIDDAVSLWSGAMEVYTLSQTGSQTTLAVDMDITEEHETYFASAFPKGLEKVKALSEA